jgi:hypothetical protein
MAKPELNKKYRCTHGFTHPNLGYRLRKGKRYVCTDIQSDKDLITMCGMYGNVVNCSQQFFNEHFEEVDAASQPKTLTLTATETVWIKNFFEEHIDEIADLDGGTDYEALLTVEEKIKNL